MVNRTFIKVYKFHWWIIGELLGMQNGEICVKIIKCSDAIEDSFSDKTFYVFTSWKRVEVMNDREAVVEVL